MSGRFATDTEQRPCDCWKCVWVRERAAAAGVDVLEYLAGPRFVVDVLAVAERQRGRP